VPTTDFNGRLYCALKSTGLSFCGAVGLNARIRWFNAIPHASATDCAYAEEEAFSSSVWKSTDAGVGQSIMILADSCDEAVRLGMNRSLCNDGFEDFLTGLRKEGEERIAGTVYWEVPVNEYSEGCRSRRMGVLLGR